jgi:exopolysaccharide biosynthesis polyprenyl glycosylphosphotransferase
MVKGYFAFSINKNRIKFVITDILILLISIILAYFVRYGIILQKLSQLPFQKVIVYFFFLLPQVALVFYVTGLYERWGMATYSRTITRVFISLIMIGMFNGLLFFFFRTIYIGRVVFILQLVLFFLLESVIKFFLILKMGENQGKRSLLMVNFTPKEKKNFQDEPSIANSYNLVEFRYERKEDLSYFQDLLDKQSIVVISSDSEAVDRNIGMFISLKFNEFTIYDMKTFFINITGKIPFNTFGEVWSIFSESEFVMGINSYYKVKRILDIFLSLAHLFLLSPLFIILPILMKLTSKGPVFFIQERLGWNKKPFNVIKFRTMKVNAEAATGPKWASQNDPRITPLGRIMRKTRLDELPQLINVLKGDMSFVGNRPIRKHFAEILAEKIPYYDLRFMIKPGLTGWSQVKYNYAGSIEGQAEKFKYELFYIKRMSLLFDMIILIKTVKTVFGMNGS